MILCAADPVRNKIGTTNRFSNQIALLFCFLKVAGPSSPISRREQPDGVDQQVYILPGSDDEGTDPSQLHAPTTCAVQTAEAMEVLCLLTYKNHFKGFLIMVTFFSVNLLPIRP